MRATLLAIVLSLLPNTHTEIDLKCPARWNHPKWAGYTFLQTEKRTIYLPRETCRNLVSGNPHRYNVVVLAHEMIHVKHPKLRHGSLFARQTRLMAKKVRKELP